MAVSLFTQTAKSQWRPLHSFGGGVISCVYFLDDQSAPNIGFVGCGNAVYRSGDGGITWQRLFTLDPSSRVSSFAFKSNRIGWFSVMSIAGAGTGAIAAYATNDGGDSWQALPFTGEASDVFYNRFNGRLLISDRAGMGSSKMSSNDGKSWTNFGTANQNGFASADVNMILSGVSVPYMQSTDAGVTWVNTSFLRHSWSPCLQSSTQNFYQADDNGSNVYVNPSLQGWKVDGSLGGLTGCVQANACAVFVQSSSQLYEKATGDNSWRNIGGPGDAVDTRFQAIGTHVYAGDAQGNLFVLDVGNSPWPSLLSNKDSLAVTMAVGCNAAQDSLIFSNYSCLTMTIDSASVVDPSWKLLGPSFPQVLSANQALTFKFVANSTSPGSYPTMLKIHLHNSQVGRDTTIPLTLNVTKIVPPDFHALKATIADHCSTIDTVVTIHNRHCGAVTVTRLQNSNAVFRVGPVTLPQIIAPDSTLQIPVQIRPTMYGATRDTLHLTLTSPSAQFDTSAPLEVFANRANIEAAFVANALNFDTITPCQPARRTLMLKNASCDSAQISEIFIYSSNRFRVISPSVGTWIAGGDSIPFVIEFENQKLFGAEKGTLRVMLSNPDFQGALQLELDGYTAASGADYALSTPPALTRSICDADTVITVTLENSGCDSLHYRSGAFTPSTTFALLRSIDTLLAPHDSAVVRIRVHGTSKSLIQSVYSASVKGISDTATKNIAIPLAVTFTRGTATATLSTSSVDLGTMPVCEERDTFVEITNSGCDTLCITKLDLTGSGFVIKTSLPDCLAPGKSDTIFLTSKIDTAGRPLTNTAQITLISDAQNAIAPITLARAIDYPTTWQATLSAPSISNGTVTYRITQSGSLPSDASAIQYDIRYSNDMLEYLGADETYVQATPLPVSSDNLGGQRITSSIPATPIIATLHFKESLAPSVDGFVTLRNPVIKSNINRSMDCIAIVKLDSAQYKASLIACGGDYMRDLLNDEPILLQRVAPNPTAGNLRVDVVNRSTGDLTVTLAIEDALGRLVRQDNVVLGLGQAAINLDLHGLPSGVYGLRLSDPAGNYERSVRVIKE